MTMVSETASTTTTTRRTVEPGPWRWWLLLVGAAVVLTALTWGFAWSVERATVAEADQALAAAGLDAVTVAAATYRDVTLTGPADDEAAAVAAVAALGLTLDVRYVPAGTDDAADDAAAPAPTPSTAAAPSPSASSAPSPAASASPVPVLLPDLPDLAGIQFATGSADLTADSKVLLTEAAGVILTALESRPGLHVQVEGHTDAQGDDAANLTLSQNRADAVRSYLVVAGVPATAVTATGYGESIPVADNGTAEGRAANRRVDFTITEG